MILKKFVPLSLVVFIPFFNSPITGFHEYQLHCGMDALRAQVQYQEMSSRLAQAGQTKRLAAFHYPQKRYHGGFMWH